MINSKLMEAKLIYQLINQLLVNQKSVENDKNAIN